MEPTISLASNAGVQTGSEHESFPRLRVSSARSFLRMLRVSLLHHVSAFVKTRGQRGTLKWQIRWFPILTVVGCPVSVSKVPPNNEDPHSCCPGPVPTSLVHIHLMY